MNNRVGQYAVWAAYLTGIAAVLTMVTFLLFFGLEAVPNSPQGSHIWGPLSDIFPIVLMLLLMVVARALYLIERRTAPALSLLAISIGMVGMFAVVLLQFLLIVKVIAFEQEVGPLGVAIGIVGVWLILVNYLGKSQRFLSAPLAWLGIEAGVAFILEPVMLSALGGGGDWQNAISNYFLVGASALIFLVVYVGFPIWAIWLGHVFAARQHQATNLNAQDIVGEQA